MRFPSKKIIDTNYFRLFLILRRNNIEVADTNSPSGVVAMLFKVSWRLIGEAVRGGCSLVPETEFGQTTDGGGHPPPRK